jgi:hypothetical protein
MKLLGEAAAPARDNLSNSDEVARAGRRAGTRRGRSWSGTQWIAKVSECLFLAGATGGSADVWHRFSGWRVVGTTRSEAKAPVLQAMSVEPVVPSGKWLELEGGVISGSFNQRGPALSRRRRSRHDDG